MLPSFPTTSQQKAHARHHEDMQLVPYSPDDSKEFYQEYYLDEVVYKGQRAYKGRSRYTKDEM